MSREDDDLSRRVVQRLRKMEAERAPCSELPKIYETGGVKPDPPMTNTPSPADEEVQRTMDEIVRLEGICCNGPYVFSYVAVEKGIRDRLESLLSDRAKLEGEKEELRIERDALLQKPIDLAKMDSIDEDASGKMVAYYWWQQAQDARAALNRSTDRAT